MNKLIIGAILVLGVFLTAGIGQTKKEYDPQLITKPGEYWWFDGAICVPGSACSAESLTFYADGTFIIIAKGHVTPDTSKGTWYTQHNLLTMYYSDIDDTYTQRYYVDKHSFKADGLSNYTRTKR